MQCGLRNEISVSVMDFIWFWLPWFGHSAAVGLCFPVQETRTQEADWGPYFLGWENIKFIVENNYLSRQ